MQATSVSIDWVGVTFHKQESPEDVMSLFAPVGQWEYLPYGTRGYRRSAQCGAVKVSWEGTPGYHVDLSSTALRQLEAAGMANWQQLIDTWLVGGARFSRLDIAFDDKQQQLDMDEVEKHLRQGAVTTRARVWSVLESHDLGDFGGLAGRTIMLGSRDSDTMLRIYDKALKERIGGHWVRAELEFKRDRAQLAAHLFAKEGPAAMVGLLAGYVQFRELVGSIRPERREVASFWDCFLAGARAAKLTIQKAVKTLEETVAWFSRSMAPTLAMVLFALGGDRTALMRMIGDGRSRLTKRQLALVKPYLPEHQFYLDLVLG